MLDLIYESESFKLDEFTSALIIQHDTRSLLMNI